MSHTHTHTHTCYGIIAIKKNEILPFETTWIELESIMLSEISKTKTNSVKCIRFTCMWNLKNKTSEQTQPNRNTQKTNRVGKVRGRKEIGEGD